MVAVPSIVIFVVLVVLQLAHYQLVAMQEGALRQVCQRYSERHAPIAFKVERRQAGGCEQLFRPDWTRGAGRVSAGFVTVVTVSDGAASPGEPVRVGTPKAVAQDV